MKQWTNLFLHFAMAVLSGCSLNSFGFFAEQEVSQTRQVKVDVLSAHGMHVESRHGEFSLTIGTYKKVYVFPVTCTVASKGLNSFEPELVHWATKGISLQFRRREIMLSFGIGDHLRLRPMSPNEKNFRRIVFHPSEPTTTVLEYWDDRNCRN